MIQVYSDVGNATGEIAARGAEGMWPAYSALSVLAHSTTVIWLAVVVLGAVIFSAMWRRAVREGRDLGEIFSHLPSEASPELEP